jgi:hypothetical protein
MVSLSVPLNMVFNSVCGARFGNRMRGLICRARSSEISLLRCAACGRSQLQDSGTAVFGFLVGARESRKQLTNSLDSWIPFT